MLLARVPLGALAFVLAGNRPGDRALVSRSRILFPRHCKGIPAAGKPTAIGFLTTPKKFPRTCSTNAYHEHVRTPILSNDYEATVGSQATADSQETQAAQATQGTQTAVLGVSQAVAQAGAQSTTVSPPTPHEPGADACGSPSSSAPPSPVLGARREHGAGRGRRPVLAACLPPAFRATCPGAARTAAPSAGTALIRVTSTCEMTLICDQ